jgi:uncharacterized protein (DUF433 family)
MNTSPIELPLEIDTHGVCRVAGTRVTLLTVIDAFEEGASPEEISLEYSSLPLADVYAVIAFYLSRRDEVRTYLDGARRHEQEVLDEVRARSQMPEIRRRLNARRRVAS